MTKERNLNDYTRVTEVLYHFTSLKEIDQAIVDNAAKRGIVVHKLCEFLAFEIGILPGDLELLVESYTIKKDRSDSENYSHYQKEKNLVECYIESFKKWYKGKKFIDKTDRFFDDDLMITGECDLIYKDDQENLVLVDLKTPLNESKSWLLQGSAYSYMAKKVGYDIQKIEFIQLCRTGNFPKIFQYVEDFELFKAHLNSYRYSFKDLKKEHILDYL